MSVTIAILLLVGFGPGCDTSEGAPFIDGGQAGRIATISDNIVQIDSNHGQKQPDLPFEFPPPCEFEEGADEEEVQPGDLPNPTATGDLLALAAGTDRAVLWGLLFRSPDSIAKCLRSTNMRL